MSQYNLEQSLSALMDGEADELEVQRILRESSDPAVRARWQRMQLARSIMRKEPVTLGVDLSDSIRQALETVEMDEVAQSKHTNEVRASVFQRWSKVAVAASVTLAVLGGARLYHQSNLTDAAPTMASTEQRLPMRNLTTSGPVVLASYSSSEQKHSAQQSQVLDNSSRWYSERLPAYLRQHNQQLSTSGMDTSLPYARSASIKGQ